MGAKFRLFRALSDVRSFTLVLFASAPCAPPRGILLRACAISFIIGIYMQGGDAQTFVLCEIVYKHLMV